MITVEPILQRDLTVLEAMVAEIPDYLDSNATHWTLSVPDMPKLTLGGCLLRLHRLNALRFMLDNNAQLRLDAAQTDFGNVQNGRVVVFEEQAYKELHARLSEWSSYLRHMRGHDASSTEYYARTVDTRVVIQVLVERLNQLPYQLQPQTQHELRQFDRLLKSLWEASDFIWDPVWQPAYPPDTFWFLYGSPR